MTTPLQKEWKGLAGDLRTLAEDLRDSGLTADSAKAARAADALDKAAELAAAVQKCFRLGVFLPTCRKEHEAVDAVRAALRTTEEADAPPEPQNCKCARRSDEAPAGEHHMGCPLRVGVPNGPPDPPADAIRYLGGSHG